MSSHNLLIIGILFFFFLGVAYNHAQETRGVSIVSTSGEIISYYKDSYALVVGVSNYNNGWPDLPNTINDAMKVKNILEQQGFQVTLVTDPNHDELKQAIDNFIFSNGIFEDNRLLFYFAGHGYSMDMSYGGKLGYIVPSDAPMPQQNKANFMKKAISMQEFDNQARQIQAKHVLYIFDSCFSGSIFALSRSIPDAISEKIKNPVRQFITAGSENEEVPDKSIFTDQLVAALRGEGDIIKDGYITGSELGLFLQNKVEKYSNATQHPQYGKIREPKLDKGDFVFKTKFIPDPKGDQSPPTIFDLTDGQAIEGMSFPIRVEAQDDNEVSQVVVVYKNGVEGNPVKKAMTKIDDGIYEVEIPELAGQLFSYAVAAWDKAGNRSTLKAKNIDVISPDGNIYKNTQTNNNAANDTGTTTNNKGINKTLVWLGGITVVSSVIAFLTMSSNNGNGNQKESTGFIHVEIPANPGK